MNAQVKLMAAIVLLLIAGGMLYWSYGPTTPPGQDVMLTFGCGKCNTSFARAYPQVLKANNKGAAMRDESDRWQHKCEKCGEWAKIKMP